MENSKLMMGRTALAAGSRLLVPLLVDAAGNLQVDVEALPSIPAGSNNIGDVDVLSLPAIPAGSNNIGDVDVLSLPAIPAGTNRIGSIGIEGYYNSGWRKAPIPWGASADWGSNLSNLSLPAGASNQDHAALQSNAFTVVTAWAVQYTGTVTNVTLTLIRMDGGTGGTARTIAFFKPATTAYWYWWEGMFVCKSTDILRIAVAGATLNDDLVSNINGYYITLNL